jgi:hypothetical protein
VPLILTISRVRRTLRLVATAIAAATVGVAGSVASGAEPPEFDEFHTTYRLIAKVDDPTTCVDQQGAVDVRLHADLSGHLRGAGWIALPSAGPQDMTDGLIDARTRADVVRLQETQRVTGLHGAPGYNNAVFRYTGVKVGDAQITFSASSTAIADLGWEGDSTVAENSVDVKIINCAFVLHVFSTFLLEGPAGLTFGTAVTNVELSQSDDGQLRQSVTVSWFAWAGQVGDCFGQLSANSSEAAVFGQLDDQGVLSIDVKYEPFHVKLSGNCGGFETDITPSALHFEADSRGDSGSLEQNLSSSLGGVPGAASWVITPTDEP